MKIIKEKFEIAQKNKKLKKHWPRPFIKIKNHQLKWFESVKSFTAIFLKLPALLFYKI